MSVSSRASTTQSGDAQGNSLSLQPFDQMSSAGLCWALGPLCVSQMDECRGGWQAAVAGGSSPVKGLLQRAALTLQLFLSPHTHIHTVSPHSAWVPVPHCLLIWETKTELFPSKSLGCNILSAFWPWTQLYHEQSVILWYSTQSLASTRSSIYAAPSGHHYASDPVGPWFVHNGAAPLQFGCQPYSKCSKALRQKPSCSHEPLPASPSSPPATEGEGELWQS